MLQVYGCQYEPICSHFISRGFNDNVTSDEVTRSCDNDTSTCLNIPAPQGLHLTYVINFNEAFILSISNSKLWKSGTITSNYHKITYGLCCQHIVSNTICFFVVFTVQWNIWHSISDTLMINHLVAMTSGFTRSLKRLENVPEANHADVWMSRWQHL